MKVKFPPSFFTCPQGNPQRGPIALPHIMAHVSQSSTLGIGVIWDIRLLSLSNLIRLNWCYHTVAGIELVTIHNNLCALSSNLSEAAEHKCLLRAAPGRVPKSTTQLASSVWGLLPSGKQSAGSDKCTNPNCQLSQAP